jgi:hypothetical protein
VQSRQLTGQDLKFGAPDAVLQLSVVDAKSGALLDEARILIAWPDDAVPRNSGPVVGGKFDLVLPKYPVTIKVSARGFRSWEYRNAAAGQP